ncbi:MAG: dienelactone hydrolase family protein [Albidovulum sp.]
METSVPNSGPNGAVLVIHSWWGLTDSFRKYGSILSDEGYLVGVADLFNGSTAETEAEARALRASPRRTPMYKTLGADVASLRKALGSSKKKIGVVGFSMGGHWAIWLSQRPEYGVAATVLYYAARGGDFSNCRSGILAHFAQHDPWVSASARKSMERAIEKSGCEYRAVDYAQTQHWFAEQSRHAEFDKSAARLALQRDLDHLKHNLVA